MLGSSWEAANCAQLLEWVSQYRHYIVKVITLLMNVKQLVEWELVRECHFIATELTWHVLRSNPGRRDGKPATELWHGPRRHWSYTWLYGVTSQKIGFSMAISVRISNAIEGCNRVVLLWYVLYRLLLIKGTRGFGKGLCFRHQVGIWNLICWAH
jgi:hypothetical protein